MVLRVKPEKLEEKERIRDALLQAAVHLSAAHGFASLGLREVSREASIAPTSFYRHFEDMQALGLTIIRDKIEPFMLGMMQARGAAASATGATGATATATEPAAMVNALYHAVEREPELTRFLLAERVGAFAAFRTALQGTLQEFAGRLAEMLAGAASGKRMRELQEPAQLGVLILLDGAAQLLDSPAEMHAAVRARTLQRLQRIWSDARSHGRDS
jgi:AcrR family transcriptional regulator